MNQNPYGDPPIPVTDAVLHTFNGVDAGATILEPAASIPGIESARANKTRKNFKAWLDKRTAQAAADPSAVTAPFPIFSRADRREADRKAPRDDGHRRLYKGDPARAKPYDTYRATGASKTKGPADYAKEGRTAGDPDDDAVIVTPYLGSPGPVPS